MILVTSFFGEHDFSWLVNNRAVNGINYLITNLIFAMVFFKLLFYHPYAISVKTHTNSWAKRIRKNSKG